MFTAIIHREEHQEFRSGYWESSTPSRFEVVYDSDLELFASKVREVLESFIKEVVTEGAWSPDIELMFNGVPFTELDISYENLDQAYYQLLGLHCEMVKESIEIEAKIKQGIAEAANEARLKREREERKRVEQAEREQLARLQAKYK